MTELLANDSLTSAHRDSGADRLSHGLRRLAKFVAGQDFFVSAEIDVDHVVLGSEYGRWPLIPGPLTAASVVYSFGVGQDISFDLRVIDLFRCSVFAFDPTPKAVQWIRRQNTPPQFHFMELGIGAAAGEMVFHSPRTPGHTSYTVSDRSPAATSTITAPVADLPTIMRRLRHDRIDVIKMDVEGSEYAVIDNLSQQRGCLPQQLMVEFHHGMYGYTPRDTKQALDSLAQLGYRRYYVAGTGREFGFLRR
jgi:FkbM family methyltransferase